VIVILYRWQAARATRVRRVRRKTVSYKDAPTTTVDVEGIPFTYRQVGAEGFYRKVGQ
jgi:hypothetical protein